MRTAWIVISTLAIANLLAIGGFIGWLGGTHRLNRERVDAVKHVFVKTIAAEEREKADAESQKTAEDEEAARAKRMAEPPIAAAEKISLQQAGEKVGLQGLIRREGELKTLRESLQQEGDRLQKWQDALQKREAAFRAERKKIVDTEGGEQFKKALATIEALKPKDAQTLMAALVKDGKVDEVVAYLNAMEERSRGKVMTEFNKVDPKLAADLLERLRTRGMLAKGS
jgi:pentatricopeptide repeat protein